MRIGLELDGVVCDILSEAVKTFGSPQQQGAFAFDELYPLIEIDELQEWLESPGTYTNISAITNSIIGMAHLSKRHRLFIITERPAHLEEVTRSWLYQKLAPDVSIQFGGEKDIEVPRLMLDVFVDSSAQSARVLSRTCRTYVMDCVYNRFGIGDAVRVKDWDHLIRELSNGKQRRN